MLSLLGVCVVVYGCGVLWAILICCLVVDCFGLIGFGIVIKIWFCDCGFCVLGLCSLFSYVLAIALVFVLAFVCLLLLVLVCVMLWFFRVCLRTVACYVILVLIGWLSLQLILFCFGLSDLFGCMF